MAEKMRTEMDTIGPIEVPDDRLWAAQTQRSLQNFKVSGEKMPRCWGSPPIRRPMLSTSSRPDTPVIRASSPRV